MFTTHIGGTFSNFEFGLVRKQVEKRFDSPRVSMVVVARHEFPDLLSRSHLEGIHHAPILERLAWIHKPGQDLLHGGCASLASRRLG